MIVSSVVSRRSRHLLAVGCWLCLCLATAPGLHAAPLNRGAPTNSDADGAKSAATDAEGKRAAVDPELKNWIWQAFLMLAGIIIGGTMLLVIIVMWGNRVRRFARKPPPTIAKRDELWFLKPKHGTNADTEKEDLTADDADERGHDG